MVKSLVWEGRTRLPSIVDLQILTASSDTCFRPLANPPLPPFPFHKPTSKANLFFQRGTTYLLLSFPLGSFRTPRMFFFSKDVRSFSLSWGLGRRGKNTKLRNESPTAAAPLPPCIFEHKQELTGTGKSASPDDSAVFLHHVPSSPSATTPTSSSTIVEGKGGGHFSPLSPSSDSDSFSDSLHGLSPEEASPQKPTTMLHTSIPSCRKKLLFPPTRETKERGGFENDCDFCLNQRAVAQQACQQAKEAEARLQEALHRQAEVEHQLWLLQDSFRKMFGRLQKVCTVGPERKKRNVSSRCKKLSFHIYSLSLSLSLSIYICTHIIYILRAM